MGLFSGCLEKEIQPNWFVIDRPDEPANFYSSGMHLLSLKQSRQVIQVGVEREFSGLKDYLLVFSYQSNGTLNWRKRFDVGQDDRPWSAVLTEDEKIGIVTENEILLISNQGEILWKAVLPKIQVDELNLSQARQVIIWNQHLIVIGRGLFVYNLQGHMINQLELGRQFWSAIDYQKHLFVFGTGGVFILNEQFENVHHVQVSQTNYPPAVGIIQGHHLIVASMSEKMNDAIELAAVNSDYHIQWKIFLPDPSEGSFDLPGFPFIEKIGRDHVVVAYSQHPYRKIYLIRSSDGRIIRQIKNKKGLIHALAVRDQKYIFIQGENSTELYDERLQLITENKMDIDSDITGGGLAVTAEAVYVGGGLVHKGTMRTWISQFQKTN